MWFLLKFVTMFSVVLKTQPATLFVVLYSDVLFNNSPKSVGRVCVIRYVFICWLVGLNFSNMDIQEW